MGRFEHFWPLPCVLKSSDAFNSAATVAPIPARHTGKNISLGLDAMIDDLGLSGDRWELFAINDNAANVKLGIKLSRYRSIFAGYILWSLLLMILLRKSGE